MTSGGGGGAGGDGSSFNGPGGGGGAGVSLVPAGGTVFDPLGDQVADGSVRIFWTDPTPLPEVDPATDGPVSGRPGFTG